MYATRSMFYSMSTMEQMVIKSLLEWDVLADHFIARLVREGRAHERAAIVVLTGDLGAGKTTFVQALARALGVREAVSSPTFTIMKQYQTTGQEFTTLIHMDAYRIEDLSELRPLRLTEKFMLPHTLFCIEWGERIKPALPKAVTFVSINHEQDDVRIVTITEE